MRSLWFGENLKRIGDILRLTVSINVGVAPCCTMAVEVSYVQSLGMCPRSTTPLEWQLSYGRWKSSGWQLSEWQLSGWQLSSVAVLLGGDCPRWQLSWMAIILGGTSPGGGCPVAVIWVAVVLKPHVVVAVFHVLPSVQFYSSVILTYSNFRITFTHHHHVGTPVSRLLYLRNYAVLKHLIQFFLDLWKQGKSHFTGHCNFKWNSIFL